MGCVYPGRSVGRVDVRVLHTAGTWSSRRDTVPTITLRAAWVESVVFNDRSVALVCMDPEETSPNASASAASAAEKAEASPESGGQVAKR